MQLVRGRTRRFGIQNTQFYLETQINFQVWGHKIRAMNKQRLGHELRKLGDELRKVAKTLSGTYIILYILNIIHIFIDIFLKFHTLPQISPMRAQRAPVPLNFFLNLLFLLSELRSFGHLFSPRWRFAVHLWSILGRFWGIVGRFWGIFGRFFRRFFGPFFSTVFEVHF